MQPWKISAGLTAAIAGSAILLAGRASNTSRRIGRSSSPNTASCSPCTWRSHSQPSRPPSTPSARAAGLADLGRRVDLAYLNSP